MSSSFMNLTEVNSPRTVSNRYDMPVVFGQSVLPDVTEIASVRLTLVRFVTTRAAINSLIPSHFVLPEGEPSVTIAHSVYGGVDYLMGRGYNVLAVSTPVVHPKLERRAPYGFVLWESDATAVAAGREYMGHAKLYAEVSGATQSGEALRFSCSEFGATLVSGSVDHLEPLRGRQLDEFRKGNANSLSYGWKYIPGSGDVPDADYATMLTTHNMFNSAWRGHGEVTFHTPTTSEAPISSRIVQRLSSLPNRGWRSAFTVVGSMQVDRTATQRI